ncbi:tRNA 2-thiouridine(34) synthase MnmA [Patescibacteria group bacterium]|nr:tRNA 2-thiouridine(34) synthase MnmA [Patescibacteria group bacterium]MBU1868615.1 tRNA 2-thiouridine(34) synthase MnmA [Patescibacteria group bacterium]
MKVLPSRHKNIAVALSGGVDSAVAALILKEQGYSVTGVFMDCWQENADCETDQERRSALQVATSLDIPFKVFDLRQQYRQKVLQYFFETYRAGQTPNPDILCNKEIKFGLFLEKALQELDVDTIATGHYARNQYQDGSYHLLRGIDENKDQSYFLYTLKQEQLAQVLFPIGGMAKKKVRQKAKRAGLPNWDKPDSQGICFVGKIRLFDFLHRQIPEKKGNVVNLEGKVIGHHRGAVFYTIGQRRGFSVNQYQGVPQYVVSKDIKGNVLIVGERKDVFRQELKANQLTWIRDRPLLGKCLVRIRHLGELIPAHLSQNNSGHTLNVKLAKPAFAIAPGQSAVFYQGEEVLGGGIIVYSPQTLLGKPLKLPQET